VLIWALGVSLASHCAAFISVSYFDQIQVFWFWLLAVIAGVPVWAHRELAEEPLPDAAGKTADAHDLGSAVFN
jgi:hypothetical protein